MMEVIEDDGKEKWNKFLCQYDETLNCDHAICYRFRGVMSTAFTLKCVAQFYYD